MIDDSTFSYHNATLGENVNIEKHFFLDRKQNFTPVNLPKMVGLICCIVYCYYSSHKKTSKIVNFEF